MGLDRLRGVVFQVRADGWDVAGPAFGLVAAGFRPEAAAIRR